MDRAILALLVVLAAAQAAAQDTLADVAGSITLRPPTEDAVLVDLAPEPGPEDTPVIRGPALLDVLDELLVLSSAAAAVLDEAAADDAFFAPEWRERMLTTCAELLSSGRGLRLRTPDPRYAAAYDVASDGIDAAELAARVIEATVEQDQPLYGPAVRHLADAQALFGRALEQARRTRRGELAEADPVTEDPLALELGMASLCDHRAGGDERARSECLKGQRAALDALRARQALQFQIDQPAFNAARNGCRDEWPADLAARDRCERERMAAAGQPPVE